MFFLGRTAFIVCLVFLFSCASTRMSDRSVNQSFRSKNFEESVEKLKKGLEKERGKNDELLYLLDLGIVLHTMGQYAESTKFFLEAEKIAEIQDYTDFAKETAGILTSQNQVQYKGEDFEKILINAYLALNFSLEGNYESALIEARKIDSLIYRLVNQGGRKYEQSAFARYLSGVLYEAMRDLDNAYIAYKKTFEIKPELSFLGEDLYRSALLARRPEDLRKWVDYYQLKEDTIEKIKIENKKKNSLGEVIVFFQNGASPEKRPHPRNRRLPKFYPRPNPVSHSNVIINGELLGMTKVLESVEDIAIKNLDQKYDDLIAKSIAGIVAKEAIGVGVAHATDSPELGMLTSLLLHASDQADLRSWVFLPKDIQVARFYLEPGEYDVQLIPLGVGVELPPQKVQVSARKKTFVNFRYFP